MSNLGPAPASDLVPLGEAELAVTRSVARWSKWVGLATVIGAAIGLLFVAFMVVAMLPRTGPETDILVLIVVFSGISFLFLWQGITLMDAGRRFREVAEAAFPGMIADALGRVGRYFAVDAVLFWAPLALMLLALIVAVPFVGF
jgi:hypothetical protein